MTELPRGWIRATLDELGVEAQPGFASGKHNRHGDGVIHLRPMNVTRDGRLDLDDVRYVEDSSSRRVRPGDVLFNNTNSPELVGKTALVTGPESLAFSNHMTRLRSPRGLSPEFLAIQLHSLWMQGYFKSVLNNHVNQASVASKALLRTSIVVPPESEQQRIVAAIEEHMSRLDAGVAGLRRSTELVSKWRNSIRGALTRSASGEDLPSGWHWGLLGDVLEGIEAGKSFACEPRPASIDEWGVIKVSAMTWGEFRETENKAVPPGKLINPIHEIRPGDILVSRANTEAYVGAPVLVGKCRSRLLLSDKSLRLKPLPGVDRSWLLHVLSSPRVRAQISAKATGTKDSMRNISQSSLRSVRIPIPPEGDQREISANIDGQLSEASRLSRSFEAWLRHGDYLRRAILRSAFSGQLVPQDAGDDPAPMLLERIQAERVTAPKAGRGRHAKAMSNQEELSL